MNNNIIVINIKSYNRKSFFERTAREGVYRKFYFLNLILKPK